MARTTAGRRKRQLLCDGSVPEVVWLQGLGEKLAGTLSSKNWLSLSSRGKATCWSVPMTFALRLCTQG